MCIRNGPGFSIFSLFSVSKQKEQKTHGKIIIVFLFRCETHNLGEGQPILLVHQPPAKELPREGEVYRRKNHDEYRNQEEYKKWINKGMNA